MESNASFPGKRNPAGPGAVLCAFCDEVAIYKGAGMKDNYRHFYKLCMYHGPKALREHIVTHVDLFKEFKDWKRQQLIEEEKLRHPASQTSPQLRLIVDNE